MTLAEHAAAYLKEHGETKIWAGMFGACGEIYHRSGGRVSHPLNRTKAVIDAARRSSLFFHAGYIRATDTAGRREILHPVFKLNKGEGS